MDIKIIIATHKKYKIPEDDMYIPLQVGSEGKKSLGYWQDNTGDNISEKNANYCELTGLYWAWNNLEADYLGLVHYRRYFCMGHFKKHILQKGEAEKLFVKTDVILPKKRHYFIETNYDQYIHAHHEADLIKTREILVEYYPEYTVKYDEIMKRTSGHRFNMFIMKRNILDSYCNWLFDVLHKIEDRLDISGYTDYDARVFGFVAERLLDVWIEVNRISYVEVSFWYAERQNWIKKGGTFLLRKIHGKKR